MRERSKGIGGQLDVWSERGAGTEVELTIPESVAYGGCRPAATHVEICGRQERRKICRFGSIGFNVRMLSNTRFA
jgi:hypothetical protein